MKYVKRQPSIKWWVFIFIAMVMAMTMISGCAAPKHSGPAGTRPYRAMGKWYAPMARAGGFVEEGLASWYGGKFHGRKTASGETYNMYALTAAHKTLPLGTMVRVTNRKNGKSVVVRINDRGPFVHGRIIDLSYTAAKRLDIVKNGTGKVRIVALDSKTGQPAPPEPAETAAAEFFTLQVGSFTNAENAYKLKDELDDTYKNVHVSVLNDGVETFYRVRVGRYNSREAIESAKSLMAAGGFDNVFIVAEEL
ncbi:MAG: septal ring lytic transglycosylase RlpA family protein [Thermodesulfobacteriota bacterium]|nr:septal ring lytic transglycosylase RlpA family protein [Thermodesulfobacteriota bacterium]